VMPTSQRAEGFRRVPCRWQPPRPTVAVTLALAWTCGQCKPVSEQGLLAATATATACLLTLKFKYRQDLSQSCEPARAYNKPPRRALYLSVGC
jgi:hypothetical protein